MLGFRSNARTHAFILASLVIVAGPAEARLHRGWNYAELMKTADLVVIATPRATTNTGKLEELPDISEMDASGKKSKVMAERLETELDVTVVMKGAPLDTKGKATTKIVLHHARDYPANKPSVNGPGYVLFDPKEKRQYVMFLVREPDGRYAAVSGQTDPDEAIEPLQHRSP
jgi:hypothetical protein